MRGAAIRISCGDDYLIGIVAVPHTPSPRTGVLVVVGGPQYRVGSHRQFVLLSAPWRRTAFRACASTTAAWVTHPVPHEISCRSTPTFALPSTRIGSRFRECTRSSSGVVRSASAVCFYARRDEHVAGLVLLNPWVRTEATAAKVYVEKYYSRRLFAPAFWKKLLTGGVAIGSSARALLPRSVKRDLLPAPGPMTRR